MQILSQAYFNIVTAMQWLSYFTLLAIQISLLYIMNKLAEKTSKYFISLYYDGSGYKPISWWKPCMKKYTVHKNKGYLKNK